MFVLPPCIPRTRRRARSAPHAPLRCCDAPPRYAANVLRDVYEKHYALPSSAGCAHELGRQAEAVRADAMRVALRALGASMNADRATAHHSVPHAAIAALRTLKPAILVLSLSDHPAWTVPLEAEAITAGYQVRWISDSTPELVARAASDRDALLALQVVSTATGRSAADALEFARAAGLTTIVDATNAVVDDAFETDEKQMADVLVYGAGEHDQYGAVVALWSSNAWRQRGETDVCAHGDPGTASLAVFANALAGSKPSHGCDARMQLNCAILDTISEFDNVQVWSAADEQLVYPVLSLVSPANSAAEDIAKSILAAKKELARRSRLRILPPFKFGKGRRKAVRPNVLTASFSTYTHTQNEVVHFARLMLKCVSS